MSDHHQDLVLLHPGRDGSVDAERVRQLGEGGATIVAVWEPVWTRGFSKNEFAQYYYQCGVNLEDMQALRLRDLVLVDRSPVKGSSKLILLLYNSDSSHYDIDAVRIPWESLSGQRDPRNNPRGKNPTNVWTFGSESLTQEDLFCAPDTLVPSARRRETSLGLRDEAVVRLIKAHCHPRGRVHVWAADQDASMIKSLVKQQGRNFCSLPSGAPDLLREPEMAAPKQALQVDWTLGEELTWEREGTSARAMICDCRAGLDQLTEVTQVVTSPPYNIGYRPFNVLKPRRDGTMVDPGRAAYDDDLDTEQYQQLLRDVFQMIDRRAASRLDVFLNVKNSYADAACVPPFYMLCLMPSRWRLRDILIWQYDISYDPAPKKYKPLYEWVIRVGFGAVPTPKRGMETWYIPILKGNSRERRGLLHPAVFPAILVSKALREAKAKKGDLVVDPFLGSGTTIAVASELGIDSVGFERSPTFLEDIKWRMRHASFKSQHTRATRP